MNIDGYFTDIIRLRGLKLYNDLKVYGVFKDLSDYHALVLGRELYKVSLTIENNNIIDGNCSCKYQGSCKHQAALAYSIEKNNIKDMENFLLKKDKEFLVDIIVNNKKIDISIVEFLSLVNNDTIDNLMKVIKYISLISIPKAMYFLSITETVFGEEYKTKYLQYLDDYLTFFDDDSFILFSDLISKNYLLEDLAIVFYKNEKIDFIYKLIDNIDSKIISGEDYLKEVKLKVLLSFSSKLALEYCKTNIEYSEFFLKVYSSICSKNDNFLKKLYSSIEFNPNYNKELLDKYIKR